VLDKPLDGGAASTTPKISVQWVVVLGVLLAISILCNVVLFASR
jgi:hypothetical protein